MTMKRKILKRAPRRIALGLSPHARVVIGRAAEIQGRSIDDFIVAAAQDAATRVIEETHIIRLSIEDQLALAKAMIDPPEPTPALRRAFENHQRLFGQQETARLKGLDKHMP